ncbi:hypothetical protein [Nonomuraea sp. NPDC049400]|uniref:hypothetical protein n=1 Tax=Nonomuraea sp. NPDC049400 TaxID=3364352 RepID=UPI00379F0B2C
MNDLTELGSALAAVFAAIVAVVAAIYARKQARFAKEQAEAARAMTDIERQRRHRERTPRFSHVFEYTQDGACVTLTLEGPEPLKRIEVSVRELLNLNPVSLFGSEKVKLWTDINVHDIMWVLVEVDEDLIWDEEEAGSRVVFDCVCESADGDVWQVAVPWKVTPFPLD